MTEPDVLVVGGGLGAYTAALAAARRQSSPTVHVVEGPDSPFDRSDGTVGVLRSRPGESTPVVDPLPATAELPADHPYSLFGESALREGLALFDDVAGDEYAGDHTTRNALVPTMFGALAPVARYPDAVAPGVASRDAATLLVGFEGIPDFHAPSAADRLSAAGLPYDVDGVTTDAPVPTADDPTALAVAQALDEGDDAWSRREAVASRVASLLDDQDRVGLPAVLGVDDPASVHAAVTDAVDAAVFEVPLGPPSVLGRRLADQFRTALHEANVTRTIGSVTDATLDDEVSRVHVADEADDESAVLDPGAVVLATGGPADGGVVADRHDVREPRFDCHVVGTDGSKPRAASDCFGDHPFARYGVAVDESARPLTADGEPAYGNLYAAGSLIGGHDFVAEGSREGVGLASGVVAGKRAADTATE